MNNHDWEFLWKLSGIIDEKRHYGVYFIGRDIFNLVRDYYPVNGIPAHVLEKLFERGYALFYSEATHLELHECPFFGEFHAPTLDMNKYIDDDFIQNWDRTDASTWAIVQNNSIQLMQFMLTNPKIRCVVPASTQRYVELCNAFERALRRLWITPGPHRSLRSGVSQIAPNM